VTARSTPEERRSSALLAAFAALVATAGDLLMLQVVNSRRPELFLPAAPPSFLWLGGILGVVAIPFYALGFRAAARSFAATEKGAARVVVVAGSLTALLGAVIHGLTATRLAAEVNAGLPGRDPLLTVASWGPLLLGLWAIGGFLGTCASVAFARAVGRGRSRFPPALAWANPALLTLVIGLAGLPVAVLRAFLTPAAPNVAHMLFFAACGVAGRRQIRSAEGG
jgi:hypothetical protein